MPDNQELLTGQALRLRLRAATQALHARINRHALIMGLTKPEFPRGHYIAILQAYYPLYQALEASIDDFLQQSAVAFNYEERRKLPWLAQDLEFFNVLPQAGLVVPVQPIGSLGQLVGILYALEGSTLGGQVIYRSLAKHLGLSTDAGARFFYAYGEATPARWSDYQAFADALSGNEPDCLQAEHAARETFNHFEQVLEGAAKVVLS